VREVRKRPYGIILKTMASKMFGGIGIKYQVLPSKDQSLGDYRKIFSKVRLG